MASRWGNQSIAEQWTRLLRVKSESIIFWRGLHCTAHFIWKEKFNSLWATSHLVRPIRNLLYSLLSIESARCHIKSHSDVIPAKSCCIHTDKSFFSVIMYWFALLINLLYDFIQTSSQNSLVNRVCVVLHWKGCYFKYCLFSDFVYSLCELVFFFYFEWMFERLLECIFSHR